MADDKKKKPGVAVVIGVGKPKGDHKSEGGEMYDDDLMDDSIGEFVDFLQEGDRESAIQSFKDILSAAYDQWMG